MCGILNPKRVSKNLGRMWEDASATGMLKRNADRRNAEKDKNRLAIEKEEAYQAERKDKITAYQAKQRQQRRQQGQRSGLEIYKT